MTKFQNKARAQSSIAAASPQASQALPLSDGFTRGNGKQGYLAILIGISVLLLILMLSLVKSKPKKEFPERFK